MDKFIFSCKVCLITALIVAIYLGSMYSGHLQAQETKQIAQLTTKETTPAPKKTTPPGEIVVFSFYDTQLGIVCYMSNTGIDCILEKHFSKHAKAFIKDRVSKYREDIGAGNRIPRIVPLDK